MAAKAVSACETLVMPEPYTPANRKVNMFVLAGPEAPKLEELVDVPEGMSVIGMGRPSKEFAGWTDEHWAQVDILYREGTGTASATKEELQELWPKLTNLKWLHSNLAGIDKIMIPELIESPVTVTNAKGAYTQSLAEWAIAACCWFAKDLPRLQAQKADHNWQPYYIEELRGKTLGLIGYGKIGQETAHIAHAFKMKVYPPEELNMLMADSDYIVAALPYTPATHKLVSAEAINSMKKTGVFINVGRGQNVDEPALVQALQAGQIKGAGLDVTYTEPLPKDSLLWNLDNVLLSPHSAVRCETMLTGPKEQFNELANLYMQGEQLFNVVDVKAGY